jgi:hypothetical protein
MVRRPARVVGIGWVVIAGLIGQIPLATAESEKEVGIPDDLRWSERRLLWTYSKTNEPEWLPGGAGIEAFHRAAEAWRECGVTIEYAGEVQGQPRRGDGVNTFGWGALPAGFRGITFRKREASQLREVDIVMNPGNAYLRQSPALLQKVVTHEFGHALGLLHLRNCDDIMSTTVRCGNTSPALLPKRPTVGDLAQCRRRYP